MKTWKLWKRFSRQVRCAMMLHDPVERISLLGSKVRWCRHCGEPYIDNRKDHK